MVDTDGEVLGCDEFIMLIWTVDEAIIYTLVASYVIKLVLYAVTVLGYLVGSFDGSNYGIIYGIFVGNTLGWEYKPEMVSSYGSLEGYSELIVLVTFYGYFGGTKDGII